MSILNRSRAAAGRFPSFLDVESVSLIQLHLRVVEATPKNAWPKKSDANASSGLEQQSSKAILDLAWAEWETIQKKIDNVSTFPFTIKTWAVAIAGALLGLGKGFNLPPGALFSAAAVPMLFWAIESKHHRMRNILGHRATQIETLIGRLAPIRPNVDCKIPVPLLRAVSRLPGVALAIHRADEERRRSRYSFRRPEGVAGTAWAARNARVLWQKYFVRYADEIFYSCQLVLVCVVATSLVWRQAPPLKLSSVYDPGFSIGKDPRIFENFPKIDPRVIFYADFHSMRLEQPLLSAKPRN